MAIESVTITPEEAAEALFRRSGGEMLFCVPRTRVSSATFSAAFLSAALVAFGLRVLQMNV